MNVFNLSGLPVFFDDIVQSALASGSARTVPGSQVLQVPHGDSAVRVGVIFSLLSTTIQGELASPAWLTLEAAAHLAVQHFNNRRSVLAPNLSELTRGCDFYITIDYRDAEFSPIAAGRHFQNEVLLPAVGEDAVTSLPFAVLGPVRSSTSSIVATLGGVFSDGSENRNQDSSVSPVEGESQGILNISPASTSSALDDTASFPFFARTIPSNQGDAEALCLYLNNIGVSRLGVLFVEDTYGRNFVGQLRDASACQGVVMTTYGYSEDLGASLSVAMEQLQYHDERYLFGIFSATHWQDVILALADSGLLGDERKFWFFADALLEAFGIELGANRGREAELAIALNRTAVIALHRLEEPSDVTESLLTEFGNDESEVARFISKHHEDRISKMDLSDFHAFFDPSPSIFTMMTYDAVLAMGIASCKSDSTFFSGPELYDSLVRLEFDGATGRVSFDPETGTRQFESVEYEISNLLVYFEPSEDAFRVKDVKSVVIRGQDGNATVKVAQPLVFSDGMTNPLQWKPSYEEDLNLVPDGVRIICWCLASLVISVSIYCAIWTVRNRERPSVRTSQPIFLFLLSVGTFLAGSSMILGSLQEPVSTQVLDIACMAEVWLLSIGFGTTFAALFAKTWRINQVYKNSTRFRRVVIRPVDVLWPMAVLTTTNVTILTTWTIFDPLTWQRIPLRYDEYGNVLESRGTCFNAETSPRQTVLTFCILFVAMAAMFLCNWQSFKARRLPLEFNESTYIGITNTVMLEALLISVPVIVVVGDDPSALMLTEAWAISLYCLGTLFPLFLPKMTLKHDVNKRRRVPNSTSQFRPDDSGVNNDDARSDRYWDDQVSMSDRASDRAR